MPSSFDAALADMYQYYEEFNLTHELYEVSGRARCIGGYADIHDARWQPRGYDPVKVALKLLRTNPRPEASEEEATRIVKRLKQEISVWRRLSHPNVQELCGLWWNTNYRLPAMVSTWEVNGDISTYLARRRRSGADTSLLSLSLLIDVINGLIYLHSMQVVHADLKAANVLISATGRALLCDFGVAWTRVRNSVSFTQNRSARGTWRYMPPEFLDRDSAEPNAHSDIWSFGLLTQEVESGEPPYASLKNDAAVVLALSRQELPHQPDNMDDMRWELVLFCCIFDASQRPSAEDVLIALRSLHNGCEIQSTQRSAVAQTQAQLRGVTRFQFTRPHVRFKFEDPSQEGRNEYSAEQYEDYAVQPQGQRQVPFIPPIEYASPYFGNRFAASSLPPINHSRVAQSSTAARTSGSPRPPHNARREVSNWSSSREHVQSDAHRPSNSHGHIAFGPSTTDASILSGVTHRRMTTSVQSTSSRAALEGDRLFPVQTPQSAPVQTLYSPRNSSIRRPVTLDEYNTATLSPRNTVATDRHLRSPLPFESPRRGGERARPTSQALFPYPNPPSALRVHSWQLEAPEAGPSRSRVQTSPSASSSSTLQPETPRSFFAGDGEGWTPVSDSSDDETEDWVPVNPGTRVNYSDMLEKQKTQAKAERKQKLIDIAAQESEQSMDDTYDRHAFILGRERAERDFLQQMASLTVIEQDAWQPEDDSERDVVYDTGRGDNGDEDPIFDQNIILHLIQADNQPRVAGEGPQWRRTGWTRNNEAGETAPDRETEILWERARESRRRRGRPDFET